MMLKFVSSTSAIGVEILRAFGDSARRQALNFERISSTDVSTDGQLFKNI